MSMKIWMSPNLSELNESGMKRVIENYHRYLPEYGIKFVDSIGNADVAAIHAGSHYPEGNIPVVSILHGLYWAEDNPGNHEQRVNRSIASVLRRSSQITVPSSWVAEVIRRDLRVEPHIIPHGIDQKDWEHNHANGGYILWNKNRTSDVCNSKPVYKLASIFPELKFVTTFGDEAQHNVSVIGLQPYEQMKLFVQKAGVYLSTAKETFGIGILEAMASGVPILGFANGGNLDLVYHKINGYLAKPGNYNDLAEGLIFCKTYRKFLGDNGRKIASLYTWDIACKMMYDVLQLAAEPHPPTVAVVIPTYNYGTKDRLGRALDSVLHQIYQPDQIIVVDDGTMDDGATKRLVESYQEHHDNIEYIYRENGGVAEARNTGIERANCKYICCLDADDAIDPRFLKTCITELEADPSLGIAYTGLVVVNQDWSGLQWEWPGEYDYDKFVSGHNQIPTCNVFRKEIWDRLGGYRQRYAPLGAGTEDAEFWLRAGAYGWKGKRVTNEPLFLYSNTVGITHKKGYVEPDWRYWHPWTRDNAHPFASLATPRIAHPARQYDEPSVSVVIPVGDKHTSVIYDAMDSLEAQTFRKWEAIVVDDTNDMGWLKRFSRAYPYARIVSGGGKGAGRARNIGVSLANSGLILYLDADDWLEPLAIQKMLEVWHSSGRIVYTDYYGRAFMEESDALKRRDRLVNYDTRTGEATIYHKALPFDKDKAQRQPDKDMYIWSLITSLVPRKWHYQIGGFDESMSSWEDWDYWIRMARAGRGFIRIASPLVVYRFYTGSRRQHGFENQKELLQYLINKKKSVLV